MRCGSAQCRRLSCNAAPGSWLFGVDLLCMRVPDDTVYANSSLCERSCLRSRLLDTILLGGFARHSQALLAMPSVTDANLESSGCAYTVRAGVPAHARDKDTRALASGLAKRWGQATSPPKASAAGLNGQNIGTAMSSAAYVPDVPRSAEVIAAEQAAEEVTHAGNDPVRPYALNPQMRHSARLTQQLSLYSILTLLYFQPLDMCVHCSF